ncbi:queuosine precursor transporter [Candidatus Babeliales bacterium]|nr:queuosine precursor transporter [Candidatus Babeliales bacterium]
MNELIFLLHITMISATLIVANRIGLQALIGLMCIFAVLMNLFVTKQITLFGLTVTPTDAFVVGITLGINLIQEFYDRATAQRTIWVTFFTSLVTMLLSMIHLAYTPASVDTQHPHFTAILGVMPRIVIASLVTYLIVLYLDTRLYAILKYKLPFASLVTRNYLSISATQLVDTILFSILGLYGVVHSLAHIMIVSYAIKLSVIAIATPFVGLTKYFQPR